MTLFYGFPCLFTLLDDKIDYGFIFWGGFFENEEHHVKSVYIVPFVFDITGLFPFYCKLPFRFAPFYCGHNYPIHH